MQAKGKLKERLKEVKEKYDITIKKVFQLYEIKDNYKSKYYDLIRHKKYEKEAQLLDEERNYLIDKINSIN